MQTTNLLNAPKDTKKAAKPCFIFYDQGRMFDSKSPLPSPSASLKILSTAKTSALRCFCMELSINHTATRDIAVMDIEVWILNSNDRERIKRTERISLTIYRQETNLGAAGRALLSGDGGVQRSYQKERK